MDNYSTLNNKTGIWSAVAQPQPMTIRLHEQADASAGIISTSSITIQIDGPLADRMRNESAVMELVIDECIATFNLIVDTRVYLEDTED